MSTPAEELVFDLAVGFWRSAVMFTACELKLFDAVGAEGADLVELGESLGASQRGLEALADSCASIGLLERRDSKYFNTPASQRFLTSESGESLLVTLQLQAATYPMWAELTKAVRDGQPVIPPRKMVGGSPELTRHLIVGMHQRAQSMAVRLAEAVDFSGRKLVADIGGGPGTVSVKLAERYPELRAKVMDLAPVIEIARELIDGTDVADRVETSPCDATTDDFGSGFDAAVVSGLLHRMSAEECLEIMRKAFEGLESGGMIVVNDLFTRDNSPEMAVLFGLQMLLTTGGGRTHTTDEIEKWLGQTGFVNIRSVQLPPPLPHTLVVGEKP